MKLQTFTYSMAHILMLKIDDLTGSIRVHGATSDTTGEFDVQSSKSGIDQIQFVPGPDGILTVQVNTPPDGSQTVLNITLPQNIALNLSTIKGGNIEIDNMSGQVNLQSNGSINLFSDNISGQSTISAGQDIQLENGSIGGTYTITNDNVNNGMIDLYQEHLSGQDQIQTNGTSDIQMNGTLDPQGKYTFTTNSGQITLNLPLNSAMQLNVDPGTGTYTSDFPQSTGSGFQAQVKLKSNSGNIYVN